MLHGKSKSNSGDRELMEMIREKWFVDLEN
jgi:hypothetical protein